mmetsp:Transcript_77709/g.251729  ORF Transcript_77709/g.251729 Transcript_77709/m.251729 type:complete len:340 (+) Transcript_77709:674-1693(+)
MIRYVYLMVDMTDAARQPDYKPRRHEFAVEAAKTFANQFLAENPLAEIGLGILRAGTAEVRMLLGSSGEEFVEQLITAAAEGPRGRMSVSSALQRAISGLGDTPPYGTREVLLFFASITTADPAEAPLESMAVSLRKHRIRVSVVSMSPEMYALKQVCTATGGSYSVALNSSHFREILHGHLAAPVCTADALVPKLVRMGFPRQVIEAAIPAACACHLKPQVRLFVCPQCDARVCRVPGRCPTCELPLASATLIARGFRQLLPPAPFEPLVASASTSAPASTTSGSDRRCCGCQLPLGVGSECLQCNNHFCKSCDDFIHSMLRQCPGCLESSARQVSVT